MKASLNRIVVIVFSLLVLFNLFGIVSAYADGKGTLVGRRYECMYYNDNGQLKLIANPEDRPYVEFLSSQKCLYKDGAENNTYTIAANKIVVIEAGVFPMLSFETMSDGRLRVDGLGLMYYTLEGFDEWFYNTSSDEYTKLAAEAEVLRVEEEKLKNSIVGLKHLTSVFPFRNGYACVEDNENVYHYFDANGQVVFSNHYPYIAGGRIGGFAWPIDSGVTLTRESNSNVHKMVDMNNQVIREFAEQEYPWIGVPSGGFIATEKNTTTMSGSTRTVVYYDTYGNEAFSFPGLKRLDGGLSNFYSNRAFLKDPDGGYVLIDTKGNQRVLCVENQEVIIREIEAYLQDQEQSYSRVYKNYYIEIDSVEIESVTSFDEGADYASAEVEVEATINYEDKYGWQDFTYREDYAAAITRSGAVKLLGEAEHATNSALVAPCRNGTILVRISPDSSFGSGFNSWYVPSTGELFEIKTIPELSNGKNHSIVFMEDGNFLVTMNNADGTARYYAIVDRFGKLISGPAKDEVGLPNNALITDPYYVASLNYSRSILNIVNSDLIKSTVNLSYSGNSIEYYNNNGQPVGNGKYSLGTDFSNGYAIVANGSSEINYVNVAEELTFINAQGEQVDSVTLLEEVNHFDGDEIAAVHSQFKTIETVNTILSTDNQFKTAINAAMLDAGWGEAAGYAYDIATFDIFGLIKHIGSDVSKDYQNTAARAVERAMLSNHETDSVCSLITALSEALSSNQVKTAKDFNKAVKTILKHTNAAVEKSNYPNEKLEIPELGYLEGMLKGIDMLSDLIDATELSLEQKAVVAVLVSNYSTNMDYVDNCISQAKKDGNTEMAEIYTIVKNDIYEYYKAYIEGAKKYIIEEGLDFLGFEQIVNTANTIQSVAGANISVAGRIKTMDLPEEAMKRANMLLIVHGIVAEASRKLGTDKTYDAMQSLYENAIVIDPMVEDLSSALVNYQKNPTNQDNIAAIKNKGIALAEYRMITLDNLRSYHENCFSGQVFLDTTTMLTEELTLQRCIDYLSTL